MKFNKSYIAVALAAVTMSFSACFSPVEGVPEPDGDVAPSPITEDMINREACVSAPGEYHIIFNSLPEEANMLYVKAEYKTDNGMIVKKTMSVYDDTLELEGFGSRGDYNPEDETYAYEVDLYAVSRAGSESEPLTTLVYPKGPSVDVVGQTVQIAPSFSSMILTLENPQKKNLDVCAELEYLDEMDAPKVSKVYAITSSDSVKTITIDNIPGGFYNVVTYVTDSYGNVSPTKDFYNVETKSDEKIIGKPTDFEAGEYTEDPRLWTWLSDQRLYGQYYDVISMKPDADHIATFTKDGMRNAWENYSSGKIKNFWDGKTESEDSDENSHFWTGPVRQDGVPGYWAYPYSYFIDLGRDIELSRVTVHQTKEGTLYDRYVTKIFELWGRPEYVAGESDNSTSLLDGWVLLGTYEILKPLNSTDQMSAFLAGHTFNICEPDEYGVPQLSVPVRYIRFKGIEPFSPGTNATLWYHSPSQGKYWASNAWNSLKDKPADGAVVPGAPYEAKMAEITFFGQDSYVEEE
ncbi:MAG: DUF4959 domain-containing protein [Rikenellaceae bacterium]|nr:DUF4959 domain-containing protein [Rikenellaceae bacterium]